MAKTKDKPQYLSDGEGGTMEPERNASLDQRIEEYLTAKETIADCRDSMNLSREQMIAIALEAGIDEYRYEHGETTYTLRLVSETKVSLKAVDTE